MELTPKGMDGSYVLSQSHYISELLKKTNMHKSNSTPTPITSTMILNASDGVPFEDKSLFRSIVGAFLYLVNTRLDIAFVVNKFC